MVGFGRGGPGRSGLSILPALFSCVPSQEKEAWELLTGGRGLLQVRLLDIFWEGEFAPFKKDGHQKWGAAGRWPGDCCPLAAASESCPATAVQAGAASKVSPPICRSRARARRRAKSTKSKQPVAAVPTKRDLPPPSVHVVLVVAAPGARRYLAEPAHPHRRNPTPSPPPGGF